MFLHFTFCVQSDIPLAELFWFKSCSIFILQLGLAPYFTVAIIDMVSGSTTATLHYKLAIILSVLDPPFTLMCSVYYIARVGFPFVLFEPLSYIFFPGSDWYLFDRQHNFPEMEAHFFCFSPNISTFHVHVIKLGETEDKLSCRFWFVIGLICCKLAIKS